MRKLIVLAMVAAVTGFSWIGCAEQPASTPPAREEPATMPEGSEMKSMEEPEAMPMEGSEMKPMEEPEAMPEGSEMKPMEGSEMKPMEGSEMKPMEGSEVKMEGSEGE